MDEKQTMPHGLSVTRNGADVWIHFDGGEQKGSINLSALAHGDHYPSIVRKAVHKWTQRFWDSSPPTSGADHEG